MTASPMRRADANRPALSGCTRRHSSRRTRLRGRRQRPTVVHSQRVEIRTPPASRVPSSATRPTPASTRQRAAPRRCLAALARTPPMPAWLCASAVKPEATRVRRTLRYARSVPNLRGVPLAARCPHHALLAPFRMSRALQLARLAMQAIQLNYFLKICHLTDQRL